jgi:hypothetical protein
MTSSVPRPQEERAQDEKGQVLPFRRPGQSRAPTPLPHTSPVEDVGKYAVSEEPDNYRQRMINNGLALAFCIVLVVIGVWLATAIAEMRRNQDCVLSGRRNCANVVAPPANPI